MMKPLFTAVAAGAILALSACTATRHEPVKDNAQSTLQAVTVTDQELRPIATDYVTGVIAGLEKGDYQLFIRNYADEYSKTMNAAKFAPMAKSFQERNGKLEKLEYLGILNQGIFKVVLWKAQFARTKAFEAELKRNGQDPAKHPVPEMLIRLMLGNVNGQWKIFAILM